MSKPKYKIGDRVVATRYGIFDDRPHKYTIAIDTVSPNHGGAGLHRYYGVTPGRGEVGVYEDEIDGVAP